MGRRIMNQIMIDYKKLVLLSLLIFLRVNLKSIFKYPAIMFLNKWTLIYYDFFIIFIKIVISYKEQLFYYKKKFTENSYFGKYLALIFVKNYLAYICFKFSDQPTCEIFENSLNWLYF